MLSIQLAARVLSLSETIPSATCLRSRLRLAEWPWRLVHVCRRSSRRLVARELLAEKKTEGRRSASSVPSSKLFSLGANGYTSPSRSSNTVWFCMLRSVHVPHAPVGLATLEWSVTRHEGHSTIPHRQHTAMAITPGAPLLPMWRSPTSSTCSSKTHALVGQDSWEDDGAKSPTRAVQCLNFLSQIEHIRIRETRKRVRDPVFEIDVFLSDDVGGDFAGSPTYQIERTLSELTQLRDQVIFWTKMQRESCSFCADFQKRSAAWGQHWPRSLLRRVFHSRQSTEAPVQAMLEDVLQLARSGKNGTDRCAALQQVPALLTSFLVRQELFMDE